MRTNTISGTYGRGTPCTIFTYGDRRGGTWYAVEGSKNINHTFEPVEDGVDVERLTDDDYIQADRPVEDEDDLEREVDEA